MPKTKNAIISVFDKKGLKEIANFLIKKKFNIYSTGGTSKYLDSIKIRHFQISSYTKQKEILDGRVKTLHPKIFGGLLNTNSSHHQKELKKEKIVSFDILIVNLYPFEDTIKNTKNNDEIIEMIDIGGHSLIRAAIKNYRNTIPIVDTSDYQSFIKNFPKTELSKKKYALKALQKITEYDIAISNWFQGTEIEEYNLRYGENPQQNAVAFINKKSFKQISGQKKLSYNNLLDLDAAINIVYSSKTQDNICAIIKHNIPCGGAIKKTQTESYNKALEGDPLSAFGGIIAFNRKISKNTAKNLVKNFFEVVAAPGFDIEALDILKTKRNLRVLKVNKINNRTEQRSFFAGALIQDSNIKKNSIEIINGDNKLKKDRIDFFINILKYVKSNAITLFDEDSLISQSGGQTSRIDALQNCFYKLKIKHAQKKIKKLFLFSDAFFPFTDSLSFIKKQKMIIHIYAPMGSQNDTKIRDYIKKNNINFFKLNNRHFKH